MIEMTEDALLVRDPRGGIRVPKSSGHSSSGNSTDPDWCHTDKISCNATVALLIVFGIGLFVVLVFGTAFVLGVRKSEKQAKKDVESRSREDIATVHNARR